jgi:hypothetical protein
MALWTKKEDDLLKRYYNATYSHQTLMNLLPNRTWYAIVSRASYLNIKRNIKPFVKFIRYTKVNQETGCWDWIGHKFSNGYAYGCFNGKRSILVHRWSYEHFRGKISNNLHCHHICYNRACVNPYHLELRTNKDNVLDDSSASLALKNKNKTHCKHGHEFTKNNTYTSKEGWRRCRTCHNITERKRRRG